MTECMIVLNIGKILIYSINDIFLFFTKQEDLNKANEDLLRRREIKKEQEVAEEQKVVEYMKKKAVSMIYANIKASVSIAMNLRAFNISSCLMDLQLFLC